jgi:outer membrane protein assembly factor BamB
VIDENVIVFNTESCTIFACERSTGKQLWSHWLGDPLMCMPAISNGMVFTAYPSYLNSEFYRDVKDSAGAHSFTATHVLAAFDLKTGKTIWQKWIDGDVMSAPVAKDNQLFITTFPGTVYKFDQQTGEVLSAKYMRATSAPVVNEGDIIVSRRTDDDEKGRTESIAYLNGKSSSVTKQYLQKEADYLEKEVQDKSGLKDESMNMDAGNGFVAGAPASSGATVAADNIGQSNVSSLQSFQGSRTVIYRGLNYTTMGDEIVCTNPIGGEVMWSSKLQGDMREAGGFLGTPPLSAGGYIIIATLEGQVQLINSKTGEIEKQYETGSSIRYQPVVDDGWIYVTTTDGKLIAINTYNRAITGWPMWGADAAHTNSVQ